jgi:hypothetical protein
MIQGDLLQEKRQVMVPSVAWVKFYTESTRQAHFQIERDKIRATMDSITPGLRPPYYSARLERLKKHIE